MIVTSLDRAEANALSVRTLGLDPGSLALESTEGLTASLLRAASFMCPTTPGSLVNSVLAAVCPLAAADEVSREQVVNLIDLLISSGDLLELRHDLEGRPVRLLYLGPPTFIERTSGNFLLVGVRPNGDTLVDEGLLAKVQFEGHSRTIQLDPQSGTQVLQACGLQQVDRRRWVSVPRTESPAEVTKRLANRLDAAGRGGEIEGLQVIDPSTSVRYYRGRWREPVPTDTGDFVGRRPQVYGADLWVGVRLENGVATRIIQFPTEDPVLPARDEAWRLQMAIDACRGMPQRFEITDVSGDGQSVINFFSPIPSFAERYLQLIGLPLVGRSGALFAFRVPEDSIPDLTQLLTEMLWMERPPKEAH
jgi:hypothetical protein